VTTALLLDVDDTLIDTRAAMVAAGTAAVAKLWPDAGAAMHEQAGFHFHRDPAGVFERFSCGELDFAQMRAARLADLLEAFSLKPIDNVSLKFEDIYSSVFTASLHVFDDVLPLVEAAARAGIPTGLLTNAAAHYTKQKLEVTGLDDLFGIVVTRDTLGFGKPDPRAFHHACGLLGAEPSETLYVGDHLKVDALAALDAGLYAVFLQRDPGDGNDAQLARAHGIPVVSSLKEVATLLEGD